VIPDPTVDYCPKPVEEGIESDAFEETQLQVENEKEVTLRSRGIVPHEPSHSLSRTCYVK